MKAPVNGPPPLNISFRTSKIPLQGLVMGITNTSEIELDGVIVRVHSPGEEGMRSYVIEAPLVPNDTITVGWVELDGWKLKSGDEVTIECDEYTQPKKVTVTKP